MFNNFQKVQSISKIHIIALKLIYKMKTKTLFKSLLVILLLNSCNNSANNNVNSTSDSSTKVETIAATRKQLIDSIYLKKLELYRQNATNTWYCIVTMNDGMKSCRQVSSNNDTSILSKVGCTEENARFYIDFQNYREIGSPPFENMHTLKTINSTEAEVLLASINLKPGKMPPPRAGLKDLNFDKKLNKISTIFDLDTLIFEYNGNSLNVTVSATQGNMFHVLQQDIDTNSIHYHVLKLSISPSGNADLRNTQSYVISNLDYNKFITILPWIGTGNLNLNSFSYLKKGSFKIYPSSN